MNRRLCSVLRRSVRPGLCAAVLLLFGLGFRAMAADADIVCSIPKLLSAIGEQNALCYESSLGSAAADAVRTSLGTDVAVVCGGDLGAGLLPGGATEAEVRGAVANDGELGRATVSVRMLRALLEEGLSHLTLGENEEIDAERSAYYAFPQISGFYFSYDLSSPQGERIYALYIGGEPADLDDGELTLTLGGTVSMLGGSGGLSAASDVESVGLTLADALVDYARGGMPELSDEQRMHVRGVHDAAFAKYIPTMAFPLLAIVFLMAHLSSVRTKAARQRLEQQDWEQLENGGEPDA